MTPERPARSRWRDVWTLHIPLVLVLALCISATVIEFRRANEGVWRAWIYLFEWPLIAAFAIWMWVRFRREAGGGFARRWRERVERANAEPEDELMTDGPAARPAEPEDPQLRAWRDYQRGLGRPGTTDPDGPAGS